MKNEPVEKLQKREDKIWEILQEEVGSSTLDLISELIELNLEIEKNCNQ